MPSRSRLLAVLVAAALVACTRDTAREVRQYSVADFYRNIEYFGGSFSHDNTQLLVSSNLSGIFNAYAVPVAGGQSEPLTASTTDAMLAISYFPTDDRFLYSSDQGGNELSHVYVRLLHGTTRDLTPGQKVSASFSDWSGDEKSFFLSTNERDQQFFDIYEYQVDGYARALFYKNTDGYQLGPARREV